MNVDLGHLNCRVYLGTERFHDKRKTNSGKSLLNLGSRFALLTRDVADTEVD